MPPQVDALAQAMAAMGAAGSSSLSPPSLFTSTLAANTSTMASLLAVGQR